MNTDSQSLPLHLPLLRQRIDSLDSQLINLLNERAQVSINIGLAKGSAAAAAIESDPSDVHNANGKRPAKEEHIHQPAREIKVYERVKKLNAGPLKDTAIEAIYREIMSASISLQRKITVGFLGPRGSYTSQVAQARFGDSVAYTDMPTIMDIFKAVADKTVTYGVVPIENSTMGNVDATLDAFVSVLEGQKGGLAGVQIRAEDYLPIHHCLLSTCDSKSEIRKVYSHYQSIGQTAQWYEKNLKGIERVTVSSNSTAALLASKEPFSAAICSEQCADLYSLNILERNIEDKKSNTTRFFILGDACDPVPTGNDKTLLYFTVDHRVLKRYEINLTKIDSRPSGAMNWNYNFFIEFTGHYQDENVKNALKEMKAFCLMINVLGSYPNQTPQ
ncbi:Prephenate dehydratase-domain-containing protein [Chytriomyces cf. hyalinus JEL632]|nr:Prephenate dehydratase-domain-containing protein [Chytriomyces cf. hyalinus JEL632]